MAEVRREAFTAGREPFDCVQGVLGEGQSLAVVSVRGERRGEYVP